MMATNPRFDDLITRWLEEEAPTQLADRVLRTTLDRTRRSRQQVGWRALLGRLHLNRFVLELSGAAVVVLVAALALGLYANQPGFGGRVAPAPVPTESSPPAPVPTESSTPAPVPTESSTPAPSDAQAPAVAGNWEATDPPPDNSHLTMAIIAQPNGTYDVTIRDDLASVCDGVSSLMTGVAEAREPGTIVIEQPEYTCDDGSEAQALSGPPLEQQLHNLGFTYDASRDELQDSLGLVWTRVAMGP
jgi:hypothetical protein